MHPGDDGGGGGQRSSSQEGGHDEVARSVVQEAGECRADDLSDPECSRQQAERAPWVARSQSAPAGGAQRRNAHDGPTQEHRGQQRTPRVGHNTLVATPTASTRQATAKVRAMPSLAPSQTQSATEGAAVSPTTTQTHGSTDLISGLARTIVTRNVAVTT